MSIRPGLASVLDWMRKIGSGGGGGVGEFSLSVSSPQSKSLSALKRVSVTP